MSKVSRAIKKIAKKPKDAFLYLARLFGYFKFLPDSVYLKYLWRVKTGTRLNLKAPQGFNEKLQWLKLYDRNPLYTSLADKYAVRDYVAKTVGEEYLIPLIGVWDKASDIDFNALPNEFVLKCTHNSGGGMCICRDKSGLDTDKVVAGLNQNLRINYFWQNREWAYKNIQPRIVAEKFMKDENPQNTSGSLINYTFYCFNGEPRFLYVRVDDTSTGKKGEARLTLLDLDWNPTPFRRGDHRQIPFAVSKPDCFDEMVRISKALAKNIPFVRVDLYEINGKIYFSEMTFYPGGGFGFFTPSEWEKTVGDWIALPNATNSK